MAGQRERSIMWFRRDLRLADHPALLAAGADGQDVVPVFVVDPAFATAGAPRLAYLHDCLRALDQAIRERSGTGLLIRHGDPTAVIPALAEEIGSGGVFVTRDYSPYGRRRDERVAATLREHGRELRGVGSPYAVPPGTVRKGDGTPYAVFTPFSKVWRQTGWNEPLDEPGDDFRWLGAGTSSTSTSSTGTKSTGTESVGSEPFPERPDSGIELPPAGEGPAHDRWAAFLDGDLDAYHERRDLPGVDGTSRLSPALKWGTIHPRQLLAALEASGAGPRAHTVFSSELAWREFYADVLFEQPRTAWENLNRKMDAMAVDTDAAARARFERWTAGQTGFGIVDAGMRQLAATGWMHNRVRMIVASFLVKDLHLPWQWGAQWFMQHLIDGDLASNNHGWQWAAGTGTDAAPYFRVFNPSLQQERYDPDGSYVDRWVTTPAPPMLDHHAERDEALRRLKLATG
jgi:deoxyribodipyrimidine photo-lyase